jgi:PleD family two-component response regulator
LVMLRERVDPLDSLRAADRALYVAKAKGRAQLVWA